MDRPGGLTHRPPQPLNHTTNGHAPASEQISASDYPSPLTSEDEDADQHIGKSTSDRNKKGKDQRRLRYYTPRQIIDHAQAKIERHLFILLLVLRLIIAIVTSFTVFAPDEHWQSLEVAHRIVFGYGYSTWEWRDPRQIGIDHLPKASWGKGPLRSPFYPLIFALPYWILKITKLDDTILLTIVPSMLQAFMAAATDLYTFKLARRLLNDQTAWITLIPTIISAYTFHTSTRTLSNSAEATFTIMAFHYWPLSLPQDSDHDLVGDMPLIKASDLEKSLIFFALSSILRPSNVLLSIPLLVFLILTIMTNIKSAATALESAFALILVSRACLVVGLVAISLLTLMDTLYYGRLTLTPIVFLKRNVLEGISIFYGSSPLHFYFTSALPSICFTMLPFALYGIFVATKVPNLEGFDRDSRKWYGSRGENDPIGLRVMTQVIIIFIISMSFLKHKETRFLQPLVPLLNVLMGYALGLLPSLQATLERIKTTSSNRYEIEQEMIWRRGKEEREKRHELLESLSMHQSSHNRRYILDSSTRLFSSTIFSKLEEAWKDVASRHGQFAKLLLILQIPPMLYLSFHSAGQIAVVRDIGKLSRSGHLDSVGFLMPCHSTPWMSHMHDERLNLNENAWFITCEPPLDGQDISVYMDESDYFYQDPYTFVQEKLTRRRPSHLVLFEALLNQTDRISQDGNSKNVALLLTKNGYTVIQSYWNSFFHLDSRRRGRVLLFRRQTGK